MAGIHPEASEHKVEIYPQLPRELKYFALHGLRIGGHELDVDWKRDGERNAITFTHTKGSADLQVLFRIAMTEKSQMKLDGKVIITELKELRGVVTGKVELSLPPGNSATVLLEPGP